MSGKLYVRADIGKGDPLVLLHGMFADGSQWQDIAALLSTDYRVIVVDLLGHGRSPRPKKATYSDKEHVAALRRTLLALRATKNATIVGYSMGGAVALAYSSTFPDSVEQLYLISTPYYLKPEEMIPVHYSSSLLITKATQGIFQAVEGLMNKQSLANLITKYGNNSKKFHAMIGADDNTLDPNIISKNLNKLVREFDFVGHLKQLEVPLTFYVGKKDAFVVQQQLDALRQYQPTMDTQRLDIIKIDHMLVQNLPNEMARLIRKNKQSLLHVGFDIGKGEPLILLNGIESSSDFWRPLLPAVKAGRRVIAIDLLGFGNSPKPLNIAYTLEDQAVWLSRTIDSLGLKKFTLMGHSLGALVALTYSAEHTARVKNLVLFSPVFVPANKADNPILKRIHYVDKISAGSHLYSRNARAIGYKRVSQYLPLVRTVKNGIQNQGTAGIMRSLADLPITILYGERDMLIDKKYLRSATRQLKNAKIVELKRAGHNFPFFNPEATVKLLDDYRFSSKPVKRPSVLPKTFLQQLARLAAPILITKSLLYIGGGLLLFTDLAPWLLLGGVCFYVFRMGYSNVRGAFSLKNENLSYISYVFLGVAGMLLSYFLFKQPELALRIAIVAICGLILLSGLGKLFVGFVWVRKKSLKRNLIIKGLIMAVVGLAALTGSVISIKLIVIAFAIVAILRGVQFGVYATGALILAYVRGFKS